MTREEALAVVKKHRALMPPDHWDELSVAMTVIVLDAEDAAKELAERDPETFAQLVELVSKD